MCGFSKSSASRYSPAHCGGGRKLKPGHEQGVCGGRQWKSGRQCVWGQIMEARQAMYVGADNRSQAGHEEGVHSQDLCLAGTGPPSQALCASVRQGIAQHAQQHGDRCSTHPHLQSPAPHPALSACHTLALWMHCRRQRQRRPPHGRPRRRCRRCCRQSHRRLPGGQTTSQGDPAAGCPLQAPLLPPPCPHGAARRRTGCAPVGSLHWWPVLRGSAGLLPPSRHGLRPSATRIVRNRQSTQQKLRVRRETSQSPRAASICRKAADKRSD